MEKNKLLYSLEKFLKASLVVSLAVVLICVVVVGLIANAASYQGMVNDVEERTKKQQTNYQGIINTTEGASNVKSYRGMADQVESRVEEQKLKYKKIIEVTNKEVSKREEKSKEIVSRAEEVFKNHIQDIKTSEKEEGGLIDQIIQNSRNLESQKKAKEAQGIIVFVSFSMPKELLISYHKQVQLYGGRLVLRGLIDNSFKKTIQALGFDNKQALILDINPKLFKDYQVTRVPTIVLSHKDKSDEFIGSVSLKYALEEASQGETKAFAAGVLEKVRK